jgi:hypothetical protein
MRHVFRALMVVNAGDVVAELERSTMALQLAGVTVALQKAQRDSPRRLSQAVEDMRTKELALVMAKVDCNTNRDQAIAKKRRACK